MERVQTVDRRHGVHTEGLQLALDDGCERGGLAGGAHRGILDQEETIPLLRREQPQELRLAHDQLALEHAVGERPDEAQPQRPIRPHVD